MTEKVKCEICGNLYSCKGIHTHKERAHGSEETRAKYSDGNNKKYHLESYKKKITAASIETKKRLYGEKVSFSFNCEKCNKHVDKSDYIHRIQVYRFCSRSCANSRVHTEESKERISISIKENLLKSPRRERQAKLVDKKKDYKNSCPKCGVKHNKQKFCSKKCYNEYCHSNMEAKRSYRLKASFRFNLADYPEEFDFDLVSQHGWYKAKNRGGDGKSGVSRDHLYSVLEGFRNNIDAEILAHPANCRLMLHTENKKKHDRSSITLEELKEKIKVFEEKYGKYAS